MNLNELRIGNLVNYNGSIIKIQHIKEDMGDEISPIEITAEILEKCKFKKCEDENAPDKCYVIDIGDESELTYCFKSYNVNFNYIFLSTKKIKIDYLHQLQNFVFAYTGTELDISGII